MGYAVLFLETPLYFCLVKITISMDLVREIILKVESLWRTMLWFIFLEMGDFGSSFCPLLDKNGLAAWAAYDYALLDDCDKERETMDLIYNSLKENRHPVNKWYYGHFHQTWFWKYENVDFRMLDIMEFATVRTINNEEYD